VGEVEKASPVVEDRRLIQRLREGDRRAFEELLDLFETRVYRLAMRYACSPSDAEDLTQEIFLGIHRNIGGFRGQSALSTWIYRVALNHCLEYRRKKRPVTVPYDEEIQMASKDWRHDPAESAAKGEVSDQIARALDKLSPLHRDVVILHELHGLTYQECAEVLKVPVGTVKSRLSNAFVRLREVMIPARLEEV
jgi:RNA polymerase sigma-70 factor (ECF subfamily)